MMKQSNFVDMYKNFNFIDDREYSNKDTSIRSFEDMKDDWRKACEFWKQYPDLFIDYISPPDCKIKLYFYQRIMLRILFRYKKVYLTFTRGTAKSFTQILAIYLKCIMYPASKLFITAPGKEQASKISREVIEDIWEFFPMLKNEVKHVTFAKDYTKLVFHNNSRFDVVQISNASRGGRRHGGSVEEICDESMNKDLLNSAVIPMMANNRIAQCKGIDPNEPHKFQFYITTASTRQSFAFEKLQEVTREMAEGKNAVSMGAGWELPAMHKQLDIEFINELSEQETYSDLAFAREYESVWTGSSDNSFVPLEDLKKCRTIQTPEFKANEKDVKNKNAEYVLAYDVSRAEGKQNALCALSVIKIIPRGNGTYQKSLVNLYSFEGTHFLEQALFLKQKVVEYNAKVLVIDGNGLGVGLIDQLVLEIDENPAYEVINDSRYDRYKTNNSIPMIYNLKSQSKGHKDSEIDNVFMSAIKNQKVKMLISETSAKLLPHIQNMSRADSRNSEKVAKELLPYIMVDLLQDEIMNLEYRQSGNDGKVVQSSKRINKDKWSSFKYGLFWIHLEERKNAVKKKEQVDSWKFVVTRKAKPII